MSRMNDLGGMHGFGPVDPADDGIPFHHEWEARVFAIHRLLAARGLWDSDEFRDAIERAGPQGYLDASYYERWLNGIERLLREKGIVDAV